MFSGDHCLQCYHWWGGVYIADMHVQMGRQSSADGAQRMSFVAGAIVFEAVEMPAEMPPEKPAGAGMPPEMPPEKPAGGEMPPEMPPEKSAGTERPPPAADAERPAVSGGGGRPRRRRANGGGRTSAASVPFRATRARRAALPRAGEISLL